MRTMAALMSVVIAGLWGLWAGLPEHALAQSDSAVSLATLIDAGRRNHPSLAKRPLLAQSLALQQNQFNEAYWPHLALTGSASWQSEVTSVKVPIPGVSISPPPKDQYRLALELQQNVWDGGRTADQKRVAERRSRVEQEQVNVEWYQVRDRILQLYFAGVVQQELQAQAESLSGYLDTVIAKAQLAVDNGVATQRDVLMAKARQVEAHQALSDATTQLVGVRRALEELTGTALSPTVKLVTPAVQCSDDDTRKAPQALKRPELSVLAAQKELLSAQEELEKSPERLQIGVFATAGYGRPGLNALSSDFQPYFIGGLRLTLPLSFLYLGTRSRAEDQLATQHALIARQQEAFVKGVNVQLATQHAELTRLEASISLDGELLSLRERSRQQTETQLALGTATVIDLVDDLTREDQAHSRLAVHKSQRDLACHQLASITGDL